MIRDRMKRTVCSSLALVTGTSASPKIRGRKARVQTGDDYGQDEEEGVKQLGIGHRYQCLA